MRNALSRRALLATGAATGAVAVLPAAAGAAPHPDAALIAACTEFDKLERQFLALCQGPGAINEDEPFQVATSPIHTAQRPLWQFISATPAKTIDGLRAKARSVALQDQELMRELAEDMGSDFANSRMQASFFLDVFKGLGIVPPGPGVQCNAAGIEAASPDADLIRICDAHAALMDAVNNDPRDSDEDPNWPAYEQSFRAISATQPKTLEGMMAKARAAKAEARRPDGTEEHRGTTGEVWARDLVNDLLAIGGKVA